MHILLLLKHIYVYVHTYIYLVSVSVCVHKFALSLDSSSLDSMGFPCLSNIRSAPKLDLINLTSSHGNFLLAFLKHVLILIFSHLILRLISLVSSHLLLRLMIMSKSDHNNEDDQHDQDHDQINRPASASMEPVPAYFFAESVKKQLPVMPYKTILEKNGEVYDEDKGCVCIICLNRIEGSHEVRVPFNCCHVFHRECLDVWVDQGHGTCPLCRSKLLPTQNHHHDFHDNHDQADRDPWRGERMIYLFGDDFLFDDDD